MKNQTKQAESAKTAAEAFILECFMRRTTLFFFQKEPIKFKHECYNIIFTGEEIKVIKNNANFTWGLASLVNKVVSENLSKLAYS